MQDHAVLLKVYQVLHVQNSQSLPVAIALGHIIDWQPRSAFLH